MQKVIAINKPVNSRFRVLMQTIKNNVQFFYRNGSGNYLPLNKELDSFDKVYASAVNEFPLE